ncbi:MAG: 4-amino-4-deoxy-L-arabinose transferase [Marmoricola sp.]|nr:4-amino-4-deoxy-L-arabinose transferase [Marmoricola sp.]
MTPPVQIRDHALARPPTLGTGRLVCIDGPSGSGKTTVAGRLARIAPAQVLHTDEFCPGWNGLPALPGILADLLAALAAGRPGGYQEWDWIRDRPGEPVEVSPAPLVIIEGVGAGALAIAGWTTTLAFLDADPEQRRLRAFDRDGDYFREQWKPWAAAEDAYFNADQVRDRADLLFRTG